MAFSSSLGTLSVDITGNIADVLKAFDQVEAAAVATDQQISRLDFAAGMADNVSKHVDAVQAKFAGLANVGQQMAGLGAGLTAGLTVPLVGLGALAVNAAADMDSLMRGLTAVAGSSGEAEKQLVRLKEVAKLPGLGVEEAIQGSIRLQAVGVSALEAERYMLQFGNALATVGKGKADLDGVIAQLVQMATKTKVVASDLKPIMERVPQVASIVKDAYGTIDTEVLQKMGVGTQEFIQKVIGGLEELPRVSGGIKNSFENLDDSWKAALTSLGNVLLPLVAKITPALEAMIGWVKQGAEWFGTLPAPVQAAIGTLVALLAAIGPVIASIGAITAAIGLAMPALTALAGFFGVTVAALAPWALAIGVVLAALVALGVWVTENWEPITAVLKAAWEGILENWTAVWDAVSGFIQGAWQAYTGYMTALWGPVIKYLGELWDGIAPYFTAVWNGIKDALTGVWDAIKKAASTVWDGIVSVFKTFLEWAAKIPGANKLMNLDDAWKSASKASAELNKTADATKKVGDAAKTAAPKIAATTAENDKAAKAAAKHQTAVSDAWIAAYKRYDDAAKEADKTRKWFEDSDAKLKTLNLALAKSATDLATDYAKSHEQIRTEALKTVEITVTAQQRIPPEVQKQIKANADLEAAYKTLGVTSAAELDKQYQAAKAAYDKITASGTAAPDTIDAAWVAMETRRVAAVTAHGGTVTAEQNKTLADMKTTLESKEKGLPKQETLWSEWSKQVSTIVTDLGKELAGILFEGDKSWGEKGKAMLGALGEAVTRAFVEPAVTAIGNLISGVLADLIGGKGFGGIKDSIMDAGAAFKAIFGKGGEVENVSDAIKPGGPVSGAPSGGGAGASVAGAAAGGIAGIVTAVASVATAISSIVGNFQMAHMETSLNAIEHNTRYTMMYAGERADGGMIGRLYAISDAMQWVPGLLDGINAKLIDWLEPLHTDLTDLYGQAFWTRESVRVIESGIAVLNGHADAARLELRAIKDELAHGSTWRVEFYGDPIARMVGDQIMRQLRLQGVRLV